MKIRIRRLRDDALLPEYAHGPEEDAGLDLRAVEGVMLEPGRPHLVPTGLSIELPPGYEAQIRPRSGLALKHAITLPNSPATIDPGYRGEIRVILLNQGREAFKTGRVMVKDEDVCLHCGLCAERCPTGAWDMQKFYLETAKAQSCHSR